MVVPSRSCAPAQLSAGAIEARFSIVGAAAEPAGRSAFLASFTWRASSGSVRSQSSISARVSAVASPAR